jgi:cathepsin B
MEEIMKNGPVVAEFRLYTDFYNYTGGIYVQTQGYRHGYYHAKILGWGTNDKGQSFWRATASFGKKWGNE